jgi:hypothetical protein
MIRFLLKELMKQHLGALLLLTLLTATTAWAGENTEFPLTSGRTWTNTTTNTKYTVSGEAGNLTLTVSVADAGNNEGKGSIADGAFISKNMSGVKNLVIYEGITAIGANAFWQIQCEFTSITFPSTLNSIGDNAFNNASSLNCAIDLSRCAQLASIGDYAFEKTSITSLSLPSSLTSIGNYAFSEVSSLGGAIDLSGCTQLASIGDYAFYKTSITSLSLPASVTSIRKYAFGECHNLAAVTIASGSQLQTIGSSAFDNCHFQSIVLPCAGLSTVGNGAFNRENGYQNLSEIVCLTEANLSVDKYVFYDNENQVTVYMLGSHKVSWGSKAKAVKGLVTSVEAGDNVSSLSADYSAADTRTVNGTKYYLSGSTVKLTLTSSLTGDGVVLRANGEDLFMGDDGKYTLILPDNATIVTVTASIPTNISGATVTLAENSYIYDGSAKTPAVSSVVLGTTTLTEGTDYTVSYSNNVNVGNAVVTVTGRNSYCGTVTVLVPIRGPEISGITYNEAGGYYEIPDAAALNTLAAYVNAGHPCIGHVFKLTNDISYDETIDNNYTPIGKSGSLFDGILDGDNHTISGVRMSVSGTKYNGVGLVGSLGDNGVVKNLHATRFTIVGTTNDNSVASCFIAAIVGGKAGGSITGCTVSNSSISGFKDIGAICGGQSSAFGYISNCTVTDCVITAENTWAGGITGVHSYPISDCVVTGTTITTNGSYAGGIAGISSNSVTNCRVADCTIENTCAELFYGVITGERSNGSISNCVYQSSNPTIKGVGTNFDSSTHYVGSDEGCTRVYAVECMNNATATLQSGTTETIGSGTYYHDGATFELSYSVIPDDYDTPLIGYSVKNGSNNDVNVTEDNGVYSFTMPASNVTVSAKFTPDIATHWQASDSRDGSTAEKAYIITTPAGLNLLASEVNSGNSYKNKYFMLGDDITYTHTTDWNDASSTENNYTAIGNSNKYFDGHFDGNGKIVKGIRIYKSGKDVTDWFQGLFGSISNAGEVKNVVLADARITGCASVGGIVGGSNGGPITNCHVFGDVAIYTFRNVAQALGGIAGATAGNITGCTSAASVTGFTDVGGIVGYNCGTVSNCLYLGNTINGNTSVGTIVGENLTGGTVQNCYYTSTNIMGRNNSGNQLDYTVSAVGHNAGTVTNSGLAYSIALGKDVSIAGDQTVYSVSGLTAYGNTALSYNNGTTTTYYSGEGETVPLSYGGTVPEDYTFGGYAVKDADNNVVDVSESGGVYSFTMPNKNVNVSTKITRNTTINVEVGNANYMVAGHDAYVVVTMTPDDFNGIAKITLNDGGEPKEYNVAVVNGEGRYVVQNLTSKAYSITASFAGDDKYAASTSDEINLYVPNITTGLDISLDKETINVGEKATVSITLNRTGFTTAQGGTTLLETPKVLSNNEVVTIKLVPYNEDFTGDGFSTIGLNNGKGSFSLSGLAVGEYKFIVIFAGNDEIKGSTSEILKLTVNKNPTNVGVEVEAPVIAKEKNNNLK